MKIKVEWQEGPVWRSVMVNVAVSRNSNYTFKHDGRVYVFKEKREGAEVLVLAKNEWQKAGRLTRGTVFLGPGISSDEYYRSPGGIEEARRALENFLTNKRAGKEVQTRTEHARGGSIT